MVLGLYCCTCQNGRATVLFCIQEMKFATVVFSAICLISSALGAPTDVSAGDLKIPSEAIVGFLDLAKDNDIGVIPFSNGTSSGLLFVNTTILETAREGSKSLGKRSADAWHWISLRKGQPMYKREANAEAEADPWHWISLRTGQPMYKRDADAQPWHWISLRKGQPMY